MSYEQVIERAAKNVGVDVGALGSRADAVLAEHREEWSAAGRSEEDSKMMALRVATRLVKTETERVTKSGCDLYEGMFLTCPRYKDWSELAYNKMARTLASGPISLMDSLVRSGKIVGFTKEDEGWSRMSNPSLDAKEAFTEGMTTSVVTDLPDRHKFVDGSTTKAFYLVWDAASPTWPSGDNNFKYGAARPMKELQRDCLFMGRKQGSGDEPSVFSIRFSGLEAQAQHMTYQPGTIGIRMGKNGNIAYAKAGVTTFTPNADLATIFNGPPVDMTGDKASGLVVDNATAWLDSLDDIVPFTETLTDKTKWDAWVGALVEVIHIDPRDRGGYIVTVGDLDLTSMASTIDIYVPAEHESLVDFGVGSTLMVAGSPWVSREGEGRLSVIGWWCADAIQPASGGWDE